MGLKFRKSVKIAPGVKLNIGKKSIGISAGNKYGGISVNSKNGARVRVSAPGTGLSYSEKVSKKAFTKNNASNKQEKSHLTTDEIIAYSDMLIEASEQTTSEAEAAYYTSKIAELNDELDKRNAKKEINVKPVPRLLAVFYLITGILMILLSIPLFSISILFAIVVFLIGILEISFFANYRKQK